MCSTKSVVQHQQQFLMPVRLCGGARVPYDLHVLAYLVFRTGDLLLSFSPFQSVYQPPVTSVSGTAILCPSTIPSCVLYFLSLPFCSCSECFCYIYYIPHFDWAMYILNFDRHDPSAGLCLSPTMPMQPASGLLLFFVTLLHPLSRFSRHMYIRQL